MTNQYYRYTSPPSYGSCEPNDREAALEAFKALVEQMQSQLRESRDQTSEVMHSATQLVNAVKENERKPPPRNQEMIHLSIQDGDLDVQFRAPKNALKDPDVREAFALAKAMLEDAHGKRNDRRNPRTS